MTVKLRCKPSSLVKKTSKSSDNFKRIIISVASKYLDRLGAKRVAFHGSRNSFMAVRQVSFFFVFFRFFRCENWMLLQVSP